MKHFAEMKSKQYVFVVTGGDYLRDSSGTSKVVKSHEEIFVKAQIDYIVMFPISKSFGRGVKRKTITTGCYGIAINGVFQGVYTIAEVMQELCRLQDAGEYPIGILVHHLIRNNICEVQALLKQILLVPVVFYLHDFYSCCINHNLLQNDAVSCIGNTSFCKNCVYENKRNEHINRINTFFDAFQSRIVFVAPAEFTREKWLKYYPQYEKQTCVIPHQKARGSYTENKTQLMAEEPVKIAYIGAQSAPKGWLIWKEMVADIQKEPHNYKFFYLGNGKEQLPEEKNINVEIAQQGKDAMIHALRENKIDVAFLGSIWGETYSYTLYEANAANCYIIAMEKGGNIPYTVKCKNWGICCSDATELIGILSDETRFRKELNTWKETTSAGALEYEDNAEILKLVNTTKNGVCQNVKIPWYKKKKYVCALLNVVYKKCKM